MLVTKTLLLVMCACIIKLADLKAYYIPCVKELKFASSHALLKIP